MPWTGRPPRPPPAAARCASCTPSAHPSQQTRTALPSPIDSFTTDTHGWPPRPAGRGGPRPLGSTRHRGVGTTASRGRLRGPCSARPGTRSCSSWAAAADPVCVPCCPDRSPVVSSGTPPARSSSFAPSASSPSTRPPSGRPPASSWVSTPPRPRLVRRCRDRFRLPRGIANAGSRSPPCRHGPRTRRPTSRRSPARPARPRPQRVEPLNRPSRGGVRSSRQSPSSPSSSAPTRLHALIADVVRSGPPGRRILQPGPPPAAPVRLGQPNGAARRRLPGRHRRS